MSDYTKKLSGKIRINCSERPAFELIYPKISSFLANNPDVKLEIFINNLYVDIIAERFDFGVRSGKDVAQDMVAIQISAENTMALVASPHYLKYAGTPKNLKELIQHRCIVMSLNPEYRKSEWEFMEHKQIHRIDVPECIIFNSMELVKKAAVDGLGITWLPYNSVHNDIENGRLISMFNKSAITYPPMYLYYPKNKYKTSAMTALIELLRWKKIK